MKPAAQVVIGVDAHKRTYTLVVAWIGAFGCSGHGLAGISASRAGTGLPVWRSRVSLSAGAGD
jgi:hypothetical protein